MKNTSVYAKILVVCMCFLVILLAVFSLSVKTAVKPTNETPESVPYISDDAPDFFGVLVRFSGAGSVYLAFDKNEAKTTVILLSNSAKESDVSGYGYEVDCVADADFDFLSKFIDDFGELELLDDDGTAFGYTGVQISEMLKKTNDVNFKKVVITKLLNAMKRKGVERANLVCFIEQCSTNLNYPGIYYLHNTLNQALDSISFVN